MYREYVFLEVKGRLLAMSAGEIVLDESQVFNKRKPFSHVYC